MYVIFFLTHSLTSFLSLGKEKEADHPSAITDEMDISTAILKAAKQTLLNAMTGTYANDNLRKLAVAEAEFGVAKVKYENETDPEKKKEAKIGVAEAKIGVAEVKYENETDPEKKKEAKIGVAEVKVALAELNGVEVDITAAQKIRDTLIDGKFSFFLFSFARIVFLTFVFPLTAAFPTAAGGDGAGAGMGKG